MPKNIIHQLALLFCLCVLGCAPKMQPVPSPPDHLAARVMRISEEFANINTDVSDKTLAQYGIKDGENFAVHYKGQTVEAMLGEDYSDVPRGDWIALIEDDGNLQLAISFGHAATEMGCAVGDTLYIEKIEFDD